MEGEADTVDSSAAVDGTRNGERKGLVGRLVGQNTYGQCHNNGRHHHRYRRPGRLRSTYYIIVSCNAPVLEWI